MNNALVILWFVSMSIAPVMSLGFFSAGADVVLLTIAVLGFPVGMAVYLAKSSVARMVGVTHLVLALLLHPYMFETFSEVKGSKLVPTTNIAAIYTKPDSVEDVDLKLRVARSVSIELAYQNASLIRRYKPIHYWLDPASVVLMCWGVALITSRRIQSLFETTSRRTSGE